MAITYEWSFPNFEVDSENKVKTIHWRYTAVDGEYSASMYGSCAGSEAMDFDAMTKDHAIACVVENNLREEVIAEPASNPVPGEIPTLVTAPVLVVKPLSLEEMQSNLSAQIESQKNIAVTLKTKEW